MTDRQLVSLDSFCAFKIGNYVNTNHSKRHTPSLRFSVNQILDLSSAFSPADFEFPVGASASTHVWQELCEVNTCKAIFLSLVRGLSTVWFNETTRIVKPNIRQRYKSGPPDALEIYQKAVLKWNLENYESPNSLVQQGIFFFFPLTDPIFSVASSSINRLLLCGLAALLGLRKARSPTCTRKHADMHFKNWVILTSVPRLLFPCAVARYLSDVRDQTGEDWMSVFLCNRTHSCQHCRLTTGAAAWMQATANKWRGAMRRSVAQTIRVCLQRRESK